MADEIQVTTNLRVTNGSFTAVHNDSITVDQATAGGGNPGTVDVGTSEEVIALGDIASPGWAVLKNLDDTNYVQWGPTSGGSMVVLGRLEPGEQAILRLDPGVTLRMQANTATCKVLVSVMED